MRCTLMAYIIVLCFPSRKQMLGVRKAHPDPLVGRTGGGGAPFFVDMADVSASWPRPVGRERHAMVPAGRPCLTLPR